jgi:hypothetical protein
MLIYKYMISPITIKRVQLVEGTALEYAESDNPKETRELSKFLKPRSNIIGMPDFKRRKGPWNEEWPKNLESRLRLRYDRNVYSEVGVVLGPRLTLLLDLIPKDKIEEINNFRYFITQINNASSDPKEWTANAKELWTWIKGRWVIKGWELLNVARLSGFGWFKTQADEDNFIYEEVKANYIDRGPPRQVLGSADLFIQLYSKAISDEYSVANIAMNAEKVEYLNSLTYRKFVSKCALWATTGAADGKAAKIWYKGDSYNSVKTKWSVAGGEKLKDLFRRLDVTKILNFQDINAAIVRIFIKYEEQLKTRIVAADELRRYMIDAYVNYFIPSLLSSLPSVVTFWSNNHKYESYKEICSLVTRYVSAALDYASFDKTQTYAQMEAWIDVRNSIIRRKLLPYLKKDHDLWAVMAAQKKILTNTVWHNRTSVKPGRYKFTKSLASGQRVTAEFGGVSNYAQLRVASLMLGFKDAHALIKSFHQGDDTASWFKTLQNVTDVGVCLNSSGSIINGLKAVITDTASKADESMFTEFLSNLFYEKQVRGYMGRAILKLFEAAPSNAPYTPLTDQVTRVMGICNTLIGRGGDRDWTEHVLVHETSKILRVSTSKAWVMLRTPRAIGGFGWRCERKGVGLTIRVKDITEYVPVLVRSSPLRNDLQTAKDRTALPFRGVVKRDRIVVYGFPGSGKSTLQSRIGYGEDTDDGKVDLETGLVFTNLHDYARVLIADGWKLIALTPPTSQELKERLELRNQGDEFERLDFWLRGNDYKDLTINSVSIDTAERQILSSNLFIPSRTFDATTRSLITPNENLSDLEYITEEVEWDVSKYDKLLGSVADTSILKPVFKINEDNVYRDDIFSYFIQRGMFELAEEMLTEGSKLMFRRWLQRDRGIKASKAFFIKWTKGISASIPSDNLSNPVELGVIRDRVERRIAGKLFRLKEPSTGHLREALLYGELVWFSLYREEIRIENRISMSP